MEPKEGECPEYIGPSAKKIQDLTAAECSSMAIYNGSNEQDVVQLVDTRGGTTVVYDVARLADGNCWMLENLRLGSTTAAITLTPADSDVASNFTLPRVVATGGTELVSSDVPVVRGPVPGDTGRGETNYGYLYNWTAATAGETTVTKPINSSDALYSICPKGWKMPSVLGDEDSYKALNIAFGGSQYGLLSPDPTKSYTHKWEFAGPFRGVYAGFASSSGAYNQVGLRGEIKTSSTGPPYSTYRPYTVNDAYGVIIAPNYIGFTTDAFVGSRSDAESVRCILR